MTKYYYKNELVRTSNKDYKFAVIQEVNGKIYCINCSSTMEGATKQMNSYYADKYSSEIEGLNEKLKSIKNGRTYYMAKEGRTKFKVNIKDTDTIESVEEEIKRINDEAKRFTEITSVKELEIR